MLEKKEKLVKELKVYAKRDVMLAFSGGVDSSLLLRILCDIAKANGTSVYAVTVQTKLHPSKDLQIAQAVAKEAGAIHKVLYIDELKETGIDHNPVNRCYLCKKGIFQKIKNLAKELDVEYVLEGTNEDDLHVYRPGILALKELGILSPLANAGITKEEVRQMAAEIGLSVANRPSTPCLATRLPYGAQINYDLLRSIEEGENYLLSLGLYNVRIRIHGDIARIEVDVNEFSKIIDNKEKVISKIKGLGFPYVTLDLEGFRSGSMDIHVMEESTQI